MYILGISAYYHDSASCLIGDGKLIYAVEEERFSRIKHDPGFPFQSIESCLKYKNLNINDIDQIAYYEKPLLKFERIIEDFIATYPFSLKVFLKAIPEWLSYKIKVEHTIRKKLKYQNKIYFIPHHLSHAASVYYSSAFDNTAILTIDGVGEYQTTGLWHGKIKNIIPLKSINFPHSLGLFYSTFTAFLGFKINEDEYKVMGLAAYGKPTLVHKVYKVIKFKEDGSFQLDLKYFSFRKSFQMFSKKFEKLFGSPRKPDENITQKHKDLAASIQKVTEDIYFKILNHLHDLTKSNNLCISGGVALNALANGKIYMNAPFKNVHIFGAAGDNGGAVGAGLFAYYSILDSSHPEFISGSNKKNLKKQILKQVQNDKQFATHLYLGNFYTNEEIESVLNKYHLHFEKLNENELIEKTAALLSQNKIIGWFQGRGEFGPRALGARSILANPKPKYMKEEVNKIKIREQFRPFAGSILQDHVHEYFEVPEKNHLSPFMVFCFKVKKEKRDDLSAIVHKDFTCRIQTVNEKNCRYYKLIKTFYQKTGIPCVLNTSFNLQGEPLVENPSQAIQDFLKTKMDYLVIGDFLVKKTKTITL